MEHKRQILETGPQEINQMGVSITGDIDHRVVIGAVIVIEHVEVTGHKLPQVHGSRTFDFRH